jgi:nitrite reductase/ring-hydroxylating ferredoxin subunit
MEALHANRDGMYSRLHTRIEGRSITIFGRYRSSKDCKLSALDSVCAHAGGPLSQGPIQDIEELGLSVVLCPLHSYMYSITPDRVGEKVYQALEMKEGKPTGSKWTSTKRGASCQRSHLVRESVDGQLYVEVNEDDEFYASDRQASSDICANQFSFHGESPVQLPPHFEP